MKRLATAIAILTHAILGNAEICVTTDASPRSKAAANTPCVFPFVYNNKTFNGCTRDRTGRLWCSTKVEPGTNRHISNNWGYCSPGCDTSCAQDETCVRNHQCPDVNSEYKRYRTLKKNTPEKQALKGKLQDLVCNKKAKKFCCVNPSEPRSINRPTKRPTKRPTIRPHKRPPIRSQRLTLQNKFSFPPSCQNNPPSNLSGKQLPALGSCGLPCNTNDPVPYTYRGEEVGKRSFPWAAHLGYQYGKKQEKKTLVKYKCAGTLINTWYVLSAAHCHGKGRRKSVHHVAVGDMGDTGYKNEAFQKVDGLDCFDGAEKCMSQRILVDRVITHENYKISREGLFNDIALIRLKTEAVLNSYIQLACLPFDTSMAKHLQIAGFDNQLAGYEATVIGCGYNNSRAYFEKINIPIWSVEACKDTWGRDTISVNQICAGGEPGEATTCRGDSGAGLFIRKNTTDRLEKQTYVQMGLVSYGSTVCGNGTPGVFTRISQYIAWIHAHLEQ